MLRLQLGADQVTDQHQEVALNTHRNCRPRPCRLSRAGRRAVPPRWRWLLVGRLRDHHVDVAPNTYRSRSPQSRVLAAPPLGSRAAFRVSAAAACRYVCGQHLEVALNGPQASSHGQAAALAQDGVKRSGYICSAYR